MAAIGPVVNRFYMEVMIYVDAVTLRNETGTNTQQQGDISSLISLSDNHPNDDHYRGGTCELDDEGAGGQSGLRRACVDGRLCMATDNKKPALHDWGGL